MTNKLAKKGFSLIELLVVIAIIALLSAILTPVAGKAMATARSTQCQNNLKQIMLLSQVYIDDNDGMLPPIVAWSKKAKEAADARGDKPPNWHQAVTGFDGADKTHMCPEYNRVFDPQPKNSWSGYGLNKDIDGNGKNWISHPANIEESTIRYDQVVSPTTTAVWFDAIPRGIGSGARWANASFTYTGAEARLGDYHRNGYNVVFLDGHLEWREHGVQHVFHD